MLSGNFSQAVELISRLRALPRPASDDPRIDIAESRAIKVNKPASLLLIRNAVKNIGSIQYSCVRPCQARRMYGHSVWR